MNKIKIILVASVVLFLILFSSYAQSDDASDSMDTPQNNQLVAQDKYPHIPRAIHDLEKARKEIKMADHGGSHRAAAIKACDEAVRQLQLVLQDDN